MTRDITDRLDMFAGGGVKVVRIALNMDQVEEKGPPPNPAKVTDSRFEGYVDRFGESCWELDALDPEYIEQLVEDAIVEHRDADGLETAMDEQREGRDKISALIDKIEE
jgi:hypothetical protein